MRMCAACLVAMRTCAACLVAMRTCAACLVAMRMCAACLVAMRMCAHHAHHALQVSFQGKPGAHWTGWHRVMFDHFTCSDVFDLNFYASTQRLKVTPCAPRARP